MKTEHKIINMLKTIFDPEIPVDIYELGLIYEIKIDDEKLFYCMARGLSEEEATALVVNGFCKEVLQYLPMEFAMEAQKLVAISLEGSVG